MNHLTRLAAIAVAATLTFAACAAEDADPTAEPIPEESVPVATPVTDDDAATDDVDG